MHHLKLNYFFKFTLFLLLIVVPSLESLNIPDQRLNLGKLFYYKLNLTKEQKNDIKKVELIKISNKGSGEIPSWLLFHNLTFIGFPIKNDDMKFISISIFYKSQKTFRDVFLIDSTNLNNVQQNLNRPISSNNLMKDNFKFSRNENCEIRIDKPFNSVEDLWELIVYLMPKYLSDIVSDDDQNIFRHNPNIAINEWARDLFTFSGFEESNKKIAFKMIINNQPCSRDLNDFDDFQYKLTKTGVSFNLVKYNKNENKLNLDEDENEEDSDGKFFLNDMYVGKNRRQIHKFQGYSTPVLHKNWMPESSMNAFNSFILNEPLMKSDSLNLDSNHLSQLMPSLKTPELPVEKTAYYSLSFSDLKTPQFPNSILTQIYSTPSYIQQPPTDLFSVNTISLSPTPTFTFIVSDTANELPLSKINAIDSSISILNPTSSVLPDQPQISKSFNTSIGLEITTNSNSEKVDNNLKSTEKENSIKTTTESSFLNNTIETTDFILKNVSLITTPYPITLKTDKPKKIYPIEGSKPDQAPIIRERIPKLRLISGIYWRFPIPDDTFSDFENGNTRNLELSFAPIDRFTENIAPADLFIQFDRENQILTALPTEDQIGKHKFLLSAADNSGQMVNDELEISVVQNKLSRSYTHKFKLENVIWNSNIPLVQAVHNLMKKISNLFNDQNIDSIFLQKVDSVKNDQSIGENRVWNIYWTNSSLRTYPCPNAELTRIFNTLVGNDNKHEESKRYPPGQSLRQIIEPEYQIDSISYTLASSCIKINSELIKDKKPQLRNPIKNITFPVGFVHYYQIPSDTFASPKLGDTKDLILDLISPAGFIVDRKDCIGLIPENQTIYGLALNEKLVEENLDYRLMARDPDFVLNAHDTFVLQILPDKFKNHYNFEVTMQFKPKSNVDMDLLSKISIAKKISVTFFNADLKNLKILRIKKYNYQPQYKTNYDYNKRKKRDASTTRIFYEYVISDVSFADLNSCPAEQITNSVVSKIFNPNEDPEIKLNKLKELFKAEYDLVYVGFRSIGKCKNLIPPAFLGTKLTPEKKPFVYDEIISTTEFSFVKSKPVQPSTIPSFKDEDLLQRVIVPVVLIIIIILLLSCLFIIMLVRLKRSHDKNRFDVNPNMHGVNETEAFLQKGRNPVILETDLNPNIHLLHQQQVYNQITPMKQFNRNPYANMSQRAPPAYNTST